MFNCDDKRKSGVGISQFRRLNAGTALQALAVVTVLLFATTNARAADFDLLTQGNTATINGASFIQGDNGRSSGTGVFPAFVRIQAPGTEEGYNTPVDGVFDNTSDATHNLNVTLSMLGTVSCSLSGGLCYEFFLDINEAGGGQQFLSLDKLEIRVGTTASPSSENMNSFSTVIYTMDGPAGADNTVLLDAFLEEGSGKADMTLLVPTSLFSGLPGSTFLYLYSSFGARGGVYDSSDGFEEWSFRAGEGVIIPEPSTYALYALGAAMLFVSGWWQRRRRASSTT